LWGSLFEPAKLGFYGEKMEIKTTLHVDFLIIKLVFLQQIECQYFK